MAKTDFSAERLRDLLNYDPETGNLSWRTSRVGAKQGSIAGSRNKRNGYLYVVVMYSRYMAHRLAWLHHHGEWPAADIDHINGVRHDNRIINLRAVTRSVNQQNLRAARSHSGSGLLGVVIDKRRPHLFMARIVVDGKQKHLGSFRTPDEAHSVYLEAKRRLHPGCSI